MKGEWLNYQSENALRGWWFINIHWLLFSQNKLHWFLIISIKLEESKHINNPQLLSVPVNTVFSDACDVLLLPSSPHLSPLPTSIHYDSRSLLSALDKFASLNLLWETILFTTFFFFLGMLSIFELETLGMRWQQRKRVQFHPMELFVMKGMFHICAAQHRSHQPCETTEHLKWG